MLLSRKLIFTWISLCFIFARTHAQFTYIKQITKKPIEYVSPFDYKLLNGGDLLEYVAKNRSIEGKYSFIEPDKNDTLVLDINNLYQELKRQLTVFADNIEASPDIPVEFKALQWVKNEYVAIQNLATKPIEKRDSSDLIAIVRRLQSNPKGPALCWLFLQVYALYVPINDPFGAVETVAGSILQNVNTLQDEFERGQCYKLIGDFYERWFMYRPALTMYYSARESISNSKSSEKRKNYENAQIIQATARVFGDLNATFSNEKSTNFLKSANSYFEAANDVDGVEGTLLMQKANQATFYSYSSNLNTKENNSQLLRDIWNWYAAYQKARVKNKSSSGANISGLYIVARVLENQNKAASAIPYYIESLFCAEKEQNPGAVFASLENIARAYFAVGNYRKGNEYLDLKLFLANRLSNRYEKFRYYLTKADAYLLQKKYDSAMQFTNVVLFDTAVFNRYYLAKNLYIWADRIKIRILDSLKPNMDSVRVYERYLHSHTEYGDNEFAQLVQIESEYVQGWLKRIKDKDVSLKDHLLIVQRQNFAFREKTSQIALKSANDSIHHAIRQRQASDSIANLTRLYAIQIKKEAVDSISKVKAKARIDSLESKANLLAFEKKNNEIIALLIGIALSTLVIIVLYRIRSQKKINEEIFQRKDAETKNAELVAENERKAKDIALAETRTAELIAEKERNEKEIALNTIKVKAHQGKNHEFKTIASQLAQVVGRVKREAERYKGNPDLMGLNEKIARIHDVTIAIRNYTMAFHKNSSDPVSDVQSEVEMSKAYLAIVCFQQNYTDEIQIHNNITDPFILHDLKIPSHFIHNFVMNSIHYGLEPDEGILTLNIDIEGYAKDLEYIIQIDDDGCGIKNAKSKYNTSSSGTGIPWGKSYAEQYNSGDYEYKLLFSYDSIIDKHVAGIGRGTRIILTFNKS